MTQKAISVVLYQPLAQATMLILGTLFTVASFVVFISPYYFAEEVGISLMNVSSLSEIRSAYGGMHISLGIFFILSAFHVNFLRSALLLAGLFLGGYFLGRIVSLLIDGLPGYFVIFLIIVEGFGAALSFFLLLKLSGK